MGIIMPITIRVKDVMDENVFTVEADEPVRRALETMLDKGVWSVIVSDKGLPVGVITERDVIRRCIMKGKDIDKTKCRDIMSSPLITIEPDKPLSHVWTLMTEAGVRRIYVVQEGKIIGRVTQTELFNKLLELVLALSSVKYTL